MSGGGATDDAKDKCQETVNKLYELHDVFDQMIIQGGNVMGDGKWTGNLAVDFHTAWDQDFRTASDTNFITLRGHVQDAATIAVNILDNDKKDYGDLLNVISLDDFTSTPQPPTNPTYASEDALIDARALKTKIETEVNTELDSLIATGDTAAKELYGGDKQTWETGWEEVTTFINGTLKPGLDEIAGTVDTFITSIETSAGGFA